MNTTLTRTVALVAAAVFALSACADKEVRPTPKRTIPHEVVTPSPTPTPSDDEGSSVAAFPSDAVIGVALPTRSLEYWVRVGDKFEADLASTGFTPDVTYADNKVDQQISQIQTMVANGAKVIFVAAVDSYALSPVLTTAKAAGVTVIAFDRLINGTPDVDFYVSFNMRIVGELQAKALLQGLKARAPGKASYTIELFSGSPDDPAGDWFFDGAMRILQPKIDDGTLVVVSGQTGRAETSTANWDPNNAGDRMIDLLVTYYPGTKLDAVLSPNDDIALFIINACAAFGVGMPVVTGQDSMPGSVESIMKGEQYMTVDKSMLLLVDHAVKMAQDLQKGKSPAVNDRTTYDNGVKVVPAYLLVPVIVTKDNAAQVYRDNPDLYPLTQ